MSLLAGSWVTDFISFGGISRLLPLKRVRAGLAETGRARIHDRDFSVPVVVYPIIALALSMRCSTRELLRCLLEGLEWLLDSSVRVLVAGKSATRRRAATREPSRCAGSAPNWCVRSPTNGPNEPGTATGG